MCQNTLPRLAHGQISTPAPRFIKCNRHLECICEALHASKGVMVTTRRLGGPGPVIGTRCGIDSSEFEVSVEMQANGEHTQNRHTVAFRYTTC